MSYQATTELSDSRSNSECERQRSDDPIAFVTIRLIGERYKYDKRAEYFTIYTTRYLDIGKELQTARKQREHGGVTLSCHLVRNDKRNKVFITVQVK